ncbi:HIT family protein [Leeia oryzae]|uniref:HIT family protein n=1 Tax=Leeia oryzae TaxID=356662 RepID=UPI0004759E11|nr:HIT family protein [Leeia oryzae]
MTEHQPCELCQGTGGTMLWQDGRCRVVLVADADYPGFCRVIWTEHVKEMTDLDETERLHLMSIVFATEHVIRTVMNPDKINLASLGNMTPHLHWHVIPRFEHDPHFPQPVWATRLRDADATWHHEALLPRLKQALIHLLGQPTS